MKPYLIGICLVLLISACARSEPAPWNGPKLSWPRDQLTVAQLQADELLPLIDMSYFAKPAWATEAAHHFSGSVSFVETALTFPKNRAAYAGEDIFPAFSVDLIAHEGTLIPVQTGPIVAGGQRNSFWDVIVGPGRVWQEETDDEWSRASLPLSMIDRYMGQVRNCVAAFTYQPDTISNIYLQCSQETADFNDNSGGDLRVMLAESVYQPTNFLNAEQVIAEHIQHQARRLAVLPLNTIDPDGHIGAYFNKSLWTNASTSLGAVVVGEQIYLHPPRTRHGVYPYPNEMRHGVWSVTKSMAGALALFYLAERYGDAVFDELVTAYVPALADHSAWQGVTFAHTLNMATGTEGSEAAEHLLNILVLARTAEESINNIARLGDYPESPGEQYNYASTNLFVLSYAMQSYVEEQEGPGVYYWDLVHENVLKPIGAEYFTLRHTLESDGSQGLPILAYGAMPTLDEAAKIAVLMANEGEYKGQQLLSREKVREALGRSDWAGYATDERGVTYRHSFRSRLVRISNLCTVDVHYMLGYGANLVLLLPDDVVVLRFMDEFDFALDDLTRRVAKQIPLCR
ncbi:serine hydrolase domain-containing protein [Candidatus Chloroploca sp. Khr17]|uniref:serine hydrolase n=1 Tax=Candidatus Chloroploca sp. Khr17 TaxID=2496869 RepID=UPI0013EB2723|nr:serine hydrolase domain-containing protein [Candidatus Chloroploca sp. Khr17]